MKSSVTQPLSLGTYVAEDGHAGGLILESTPETSVSAPVPGRCADLVLGLHGARVLTGSCQGTGAAELTVQLLWLCLSISHGLPSPWDFPWFLGIPLTPVGGCEGGAHL